MFKPTYLARLQACRNKFELADLLQIKITFLTNVLYRIRPENQYKRFTIKKKSGGEREIFAPDDKLKDIQKRLSELLYICQEEILTKNNTNRNLSHGFERNKTIITNAERHRNKNAVLNIDIENFFPSFNFGRVRGFFIANQHFKLHPNVATIIAQIACFDGKLPQGSPCSPVITNLICRVLDFRLSRLAVAYGCSYSRYADDITFSTNKKNIPEALVSNEEKNEVGEILVNEIHRAGFTLNHQKSRVSRCTSRQQVTGLIVNKKINVSREYIKNTRAMAHSLYLEGSYTIIGKDGKPRKGTLSELEGRFSFIDMLDKYNNVEDKKNALPEKYVIKGFGLDFKKRLNSREKAYSKFLYYKNFYGNEQLTVLTEGKTDPVYLKCAIDSLYLEFPQLVREEKNTKNRILKINLFKANEKKKYFLDLSGGAADYTRFLKRHGLFCKMYERQLPKNPVIILFDNDTGPSDFINQIIKEYPHLPKSQEDVRKGTFYHLEKNLYVLFTPLLPGGKYSSLEDFFKPAVLGMKYNGKSFDKSNEHDSATTFGKDRFANYIVRENRKVIDFSLFKPILNSIVEISEHFIKLYPPK
ncbi:retron Ec67 family RNA-directed DNA polymerase/endonuclease [Phytobacter sp. SCO41]|uniref:retron Ec67 family RNA-directed DNA polymerase/endonuclease n=1 Tax=Phytobacter sp. SCO41 TaxID=1756993 RepID=UPI000D50124A|nr:retron Ec67 family RNA-directed DNA polymerase/endonuclease [Phytobacter sp. SCO41]